MKHTIDWVMLVLLIIGGLNWGLVGLINLDLVASLFGLYSLLSRILYVLVGISAVYIAFRSSQLLKIDSKRESKSKATA